MCIRDRDCYADSELKVSKDNFEKPLELSIEVDCDKLKKEASTEKDPADELKDVLDF